MEASSNGMLCDNYNKYPGCNTTKFEGKARPARKADNLTAISEPIV
jgi:hypothetical protein